MDIHITWLGRSAFLIEIGTFRILTDPYLKDNPDAKIGPDDVSADLILVSHGHFDHVGDSIEISNRCKIPILTNPEICQWLKVHQAEQTIPLYISGQREFPFGSIKAVSAAHGSSMPDGSYGGLALGFIISAKDGRKIYFAGDTGLFGDMRLIGEENIALAMIPIGDTYVLGQDEAIRAIRLIEPQKVIPMHFPPNLELDGWIKKVQSATETEPVIPKIGSRITL